MIEKERKFIAKYIPPIAKKTPLYYIAQGYLMLAGKRQLRIRLISQTDTGEQKAILCYKNCFSSTDREEYEFEIPFEQGQELYKSCETRLKKHRYQFLHGKLHIDIDMYPDGLEIVEIEYSDKLEDKDIPDFCGEEVTGVGKYSNIYIAQKQSNIS